MPATRKYQVVVTVTARRVINVYSPNGPKAAAAEAEEKVRAIYKHAGDTVKAVAVNYYTRKGGESHYYPDDGYTVVAKGNG